MKASEIKLFTDKELTTKLADARLELTRLKLSHAVSPSPSTMVMKEVQRDIARFLTERTSRKNNVVNA